MNCPSCSSRDTSTTKTLRGDDCILRAHRCSSCGGSWRTRQSFEKGSFSVGIPPESRGIQPTNVPAQRQEKREIKQLGLVSSDSSIFEGGLGGVRSGSGPDSENGERKSSSKNSVPPPGFMRFWDVQIRKVSRAAAEKAWRAKNCEPITDLVIAAWQRQLPEMRKRDTDKVPHPSTWLNGERWNDEVGKAPVATPAVSAKPKETRQSLHIRLTAIRAKMAQVRKEQGLEDFCRGKSQEHDKLEQEQADIIRALQLLGSPEDERC